MSRINDTIIKVSESSLFLSSVCFSRFFSLSFSHKSLTSFFVLFSPADLLFWGGRKPKARTRITGTPPTRVRHHMAEHDDIVHSLSLMLYRLTYTTPMYVYIDTKYRTMCVCSFQESRFYAIKIYHPNSDHLIYDNSCALLTRFLLCHFIVSFSQENHQFFLQIRYYR